MTSSQATLPTVPVPQAYRDEQALIANAVASRPDIADDVSRQLETILGTTGRRLWSRISRGRIAHEIGAGRRGINIDHEAFGLNELLIALFRLDEASAGSLVAIEEPEIHLHPKAQAALCRVLVDVVTSERKQLILTTHSEH